MLVSMVEIAGHTTLILWRAVYLLTALKAFKASTSRIASVSSNVKISLSLHVLQPHILLHVQHRFAGVQQEFVHRH